jgi:hypothetical protein
LHPHPFHPLPPGEGRGEGIQGEGVGLSQLLEAIFRAAQVVTNFR